MAAGREQTARIVISDAEINNLVQDPDSPDRVTAITKARPGRRKLVLATLYGVGANPGGRGYPSAAFTGNARSVRSNTEQGVYPVDVTFFQK